MCFSWKEIYVYNIRIIARVWVFKCGQLENDVQWNSSVNWSHSLVFSQLVPAAFSKLSSAKNCCVSVVFNLVTLQQWHIQGSNCVTAPLWSYRKFLDSFCTVFVNIPFCDWTIKSVTRGFCLLKKLHQNTPKVIIFDDKKWLFWGMAQPLRHTLPRRRLQCFTLSLLKS